MPRIALNGQILVICELYQTRVICEPTKRYVVNWYFEFAACKLLLFFFSLLDFYIVEVKIVHLMNNMLENTIKDYSR